MNQRRYSDLQILRRLMEQAKPLWSALVGTLVVNFFATPLALLVPLPLKLVVDHVIGHRPPSALWRSLIPSIESGKWSMLVLAIVLLIGIALLTQFQSLANWLCEAYVSERLVLELRARLFDQAQRLSLLYHDRAGTTDSIYRIQYDAPAIQWILVHGISPFITATCTIAGMVYIISRMSGQLSAIAVAVAPVLFVMAEFYRRRVRTRWHELKKVETSSMSVLEETLGAIRVVKAFGQEERQHRDYLKKARSGVRRHVQLAFYDGAFGALVGMTIASGTAAVLFFGVQQVQSGVLSLGQLLVAMSYVTQLYAPVRSISSQIGQLESSMASGERALALLDQPRDVLDRRHARPLAAASGHFQFRDVSFAYEPDRAVLDGITFSVRPASRVGISGTTGAGKTTLVSLLVRFFDPTSGQVLLDGVDLREFRLEDLRRQFAIVLQEPVLFSSSIAENIAYARPDASEQEIKSAAIAANAHDFIMQLPNGYESTVGQRGATLSGGERQRISLARAFLKNAPVLVLDEPTSSVDMTTELAIMEAMERLVAGRTTFIIAHRLSTLDKCDVRLHLEHGRLVNDSRAIPATSTSHP
jgi:ATP-binding cassette subfamily B protein